jgi:hypothetical protein
MRGRGVGLGDRTGTAEVGWVARGSGVGGTVQVSLVTASSIEHSDSARNPNYRGRVGGRDSDFVFKKTGSLFECTEYAGNAATQHKPSRDNLS